MQSHKSWMRKETKSKYDKTNPGKPISHEWEKKRRVNMTKLNHAKIYSSFLFSFMTYGFAWFSFVIFTLRFFSHSWLMALHGLVLSYLLFVQPCKAISHEWEKKPRVNMTKLNHAKP
jgi:hypothetical protein